MASYGQPRRLNALTVFMILCAAAISYLGWRFFPSYFDAWSIDHILKEGATSVYLANRLAEPMRTQELNKIVEKARTEIVKRVGILDPELTVNLNLDEDRATMSADYGVVVTHPGLAHVTNLHFHRERESNIKNVKWE